jgi:hypothetical protein
MCALFRRALLSNFTHCTCACAVSIICYMHKLMKYEWNLRWTSVGFSIVECFPCSALFIIIFNETVDASQLCTSSLSIFWERFLLDIKVDLLAPTDAHVGISIWLVQVHLDAFHCLMFKLFNAQIETDAICMSQICLLLYSTDSTYSFLKRRYWHFPR